MIPDPEAEGSSFIAVADAEFRRPDGRLDLATLLGGDEFAQVPPEEAARWSSLDAEVDASATQDPDDATSSHDGDDGPVELGRFVTLGRGVEFLPPPAWGRSVDRVDASPHDAFDGFRARGHRGGAGRSVPPHAAHSVRWRTGSRPSAGRGRTIVGPDAWIGAGSVIVGGVVIGAGAVIAPGSVVVRDVEPYAMVQGRPAARIGWRFEPAVIRELLAIRWWDWPIEQFVARCRAASDAVRAPG
jgi:acetyltransferase-like isoleucine patch superfamily enzyme